MNPNKAFASMALFAITISATFSVHSARARAVSASEAAGFIREAHFPNMEWYTSTGYAKGILPESGKPCWVAFSDFNMDFNEVILTISNGEPLAETSKDLASFKIFVNAIGGHEAPTVIESADTTKGVTKITARNDGKVQTLTLGRKNESVSSVTIEEGANKVTCELATATNASIQSLVSHIQKTLAEGRHDSGQTKSSDPLEMVKEYIAKKYEYDTEIFKGYRFVKDATSLTVDEPVAGLLKTSAVLHEVRSGEGTEAVEADFKALLKTQAVFGFDGFEQNACAAPTPFLLVLDPANKTVYGIDLSPCRN